MTDTQTVVNIIAITLLGAGLVLISACRTSLPQELRIPGMNFLSGRRWAISAYSLILAAFVMLSLTCVSWPGQICNLLPLLFISLQALLIYIFFTVVIDAAGVSRGKTLRQAFIILGLSAAYIVCYLIFGLPDTSTPGRMAINILHPTTIAWWIFAIWTVIQTGGYLLSFRREAERVAGNDAIYPYGIDTARLRRVKTFFYFTLIIWAVCFAAIFLGGYAGLSPVFKSAIALCYFLFSVRYIKSCYQLPLAEAVKIISEQQSSVQHKLDIGKLLKEQIHDKYLFTRPYLTMTDVAKEIGTSRTLLSNYLNRELGMSFNYWLCVLRIEYAKQIMETDPSMNIGAVAEKVGFSEPTNFIRKFKQISDCTPLQWKKMRKR